MKTKSLSFKGICLFLISAFLFTCAPAGFTQAQMFAAPAGFVNLPAPNQFVPLSQNYSLPTLKGLKLNPQNPLEIEFIIDPAGNKTITKEETAKLIRYFLAGLALPEKDLWVNLSPVEKDRIAGGKLADTELGQDLLGEDYILKQLSSSLLYPQTPTGKDYWQTIYQEVAKLSHTTDLPIDTFNRIWIMPDSAQVYEDGNVVLVAQAKLKTLLEEDYAALSRNHAVTNTKSSSLNSEVNKVAAKAMREIVLPKINDDVNNGKNFAQLRQIYNSLILAEWFKNKFMKSFYKDYFNSAKLSGIAMADKTAKDKIFKLYVEAFKKGIYNYTQKEIEPVSGKTIRRNYFSGGAVFAGTAAATNVAANPNILAEMQGLPAIRAKSSLEIIDEVSGAGDDSAGITTPAGNQKTTTKNNHSLVKNIAAGVMVAVGGIIAGCTQNPVQTKETPNKVWIADSASIKSLADTLVRSDSLDRRIKSAQQLSARGDTTVVDTMALVFTLSGTPDTVKTATTQALLEIAKRYHSVDAYGLVLQYGRPDSARINAVGGLGADGKDPNAVKDLINALVGSSRDSSEAVRLSIVAQLATLGGTDAQGALVKAVGQDPSAKVRQKAAESLSVSALLNVLKTDTSEASQLTVLNLLGTNGDTSAIASIGQILQTSKIADINIAGSQALLNIAQRYNSVLAYGLVLSYGSPDSMKINAVNGLGTNGKDPNAVKDLINAVLGTTRDPSEAVRLSVVSVLGTLSGSDVQDVLVKVVGQDPSAKVRQKAGESLSVSALLNVLKTDTSEASQLTVLNLLGTNGDTSAIAPIGQILQTSKIADINIAASQSLLNIAQRYNSVLAYGLVLSYGHPDSIKINSVNGLGANGKDTNAVKDLINTVLGTTRDPSEAVRLSVVSVLGTLSGADVQDALVKIASQDLSAKVRQKANETLSAFSLDSLSPSALLNVVKNDTSEVRQARALSLLGEKGDTSVIASITPILPIGITTTGNLNDTSLSINIAASQALLALGQKYSRQDAVTAVFEYAKTDALRIQAVGILGKIDDLTGLENLVEHGVGTGNGFAFENSQAIQDTVKAVLIAKANAQLKEYILNKLLTNPVGTITAGNLVAVLSAAKLNDLSLDSLGNYLDKFSSHNTNELSTSVYTADSVRAQIVGSITTKIGSGQDPAIVEMLGKSLNNNIANTDSYRYYTSELAEISLLSRLGKPARTYLFQAFTAKTFVIQDTILSDSLSAAINPLVDASMLTQLQSVITNPSFNSNYSFNLQLVKIVEWFLRAGGDKLTAEKILLPLFGGVISNSQDVADSSLKVFEGIMDTNSVPLLTGYIISNPNPSSIRTLAGDICFSLLAKIGNLTATKFFYDYYLSKMALGNRGMILSLIETGALIEPIDLLLQLSRQETDLNNLQRINALIYKNLSSLNISQYSDNALIAGLSDSSFLYKASCANELYKRGNSDNLALAQKMVVWPYLQSGAIGVDRDLAYKTMGDIAVGPLKQVAEGKVSGFYPGEALYGLGLIGNFDDVFSAMVEASSNSSASGNDRWAGFRALFERQPLATIQQYLNSTNECVKIGAIFGLLKQSPQEGIDSACWVINLDQPYWLPHYGGFIFGSNATTEMVDAVAEIGGKKALDFLVYTVQHSQDYYIDTRMDAAEWIGKLGDTSYISALEIAETLDIPSWWNQEAPDITQSEYFHYVIQKAINAIKQRYGLPTTGFNQVETDSRLAKAAAPASSTTTGGLSSLLNDHEPLTLQFNRIAADTSVPAPLRELAKFNYDNLRPYETGEKTPGNPQQIAMAVQNSQAGSEAVSQALPDTDSKVGGIDMSIEVKTAPGSKPGQFNIPSELKSGKFYGIKIKDIEVGEVKTIGEIIKE